MNFHRARFNPLLFSHQYRGRGLRSNGTVNLGQPAPATGRRLLQGSNSSTTEIGDGGLQSTGHVAVAAGTTLKFVADTPSEISGQGLDSDGTISITAGSVLISGGTSLLANGGSYIKFVG
jgi:hypothetical protein